MSEHLTLINVLTAVAASVLYVVTWYFIVEILLSRKNAAASWAWILAIVFLPYIGAIAYVIFGHERLSRPRLRQRCRHLEEIRPHFDGMDHRDSAARIDASQTHDADVIGGSLSPHIRQNLREAAILARMPPTRYNTTKFLSDGNAMFDALGEAIDAARHHIHLEFYIWRNDATGNGLVERLIAARERGVEVRLLVDHVGSLTTETAMFDSLVRAGGKFAWFMPANFVWSPKRAHLRNHRKLVVVDGETALTGGINVGDEYRGGVGQQFEVWADVFMRLKGPAAIDLQEVFIEDWFTGSGEDLSERDIYFHPYCESEDNAAAIDPFGNGDDIIQIISSGPDESVNAIHGIMFAGCLAARERAWLTTPYFVPTEAILEALKLAARRGVDVRLLFPSRRTNHPMVFYAGRWYYQELLEAGVKIFEFQPGLVHAKLMMVDGEWGSVGSANMDIRSFRLNFELNALIFSKRFTADLEEYFLARGEESEEITLEILKGLPLREKLLKGLARLFSGVL